LYSISRYVLVKATWAHRALFIKPRSSWEDLRWPRDFDQHRLSVCCWHSCWSMTSRWLCSKQQQQQQHQWVVDDACWPLQTNPVNYNTQQW